MCLGAGRRRTDPACQGFGQHERGAKKPAIASCDALAENESARQVMGESILRVIAHELVVSIKDSVSVDWMHRETARARMRVLMKRLLRKYGYPPDAGCGGAECLAAGRGAVVGMGSVTDCVRATRPSLDRLPVEHDVGEPSTRLLLQSPPLR
jgi:hypothetical protein